MKIHPGLLFAGALLLGAPLPAEVATSNPAIKAAPRNDWIVRHEGFVAQAKAGNIELLFIGDSITDGWRVHGKTIWDQQYAPLKAANFGIGGDRTEHVLWRLQNGELEGISPKVAVVMIGTNNTGRDTAPQIADGVAAILNEIRSKTPATKILLLAVFPRAEKPDAPSRIKIGEINQIIARLDDGKNIFYLDIGKSFLQPDGILSPSVMPDFLHPNPEGYRIWTEAMGPKLADLLGMK